MSKSTEVYQKQGKGKPWGCLLTVLAAFFILGSSIYFLLEPVRQAKGQEQALLDKFGPADQYTPPHDGFLAAQRVEAFIRVRQAIQASCTGYREILDDLLGLEALETDKNMTGNEKMSTGISGLSSLIGAGPQLLKFMRARNGTLLEENMGLGEYLYIYLTAYAEQLEQASNSPYSQMDEAYVSPRSRHDFVQILSNQLEALESKPQASAVDLTDDLSSHLRAEIKALEEGVHRSPWPDGTAGLSAESLVPFREQLTRLYCSGVVGIELQQKNQGLNFAN